MQLTWSGRDVNTYISTPSYVLQVRRRKLQSYVETLLKCKHFCNSGRRTKHSTIFFTQKVEVTLNFRSLEHTFTITFDQGWRTGYLFPKNSFETTPHSCDQPHYVEGLSSRTGLTLIEQRHRWQAFSFRKIFRSLVKVVVGVICVNFLFVL